MSHPTFRKLFYSLALIALAVSLTRPSGVATADRVPPPSPPPGACYGEPTDPPECTQNYGGATTGSSTDTDGDGVADSNDPCPKDKNAVKDEKGYCPSDETGQRNSSPGSLQAFIQDSTGIEDLYTPTGGKVLGLEPGLLENFASTPVGTTITLPVSSGQYVLLTNAGNGSFTGKFEDGDFSFYRIELVKKTLCDPATVNAAWVAALDASIAADEANAAAIAADVHAANANAFAFDAYVVAQATAANAAINANAANAANAADASIAAKAATDASIAANAAKAAADADDDDARAAADAAQAVYDSLRKNCP